MLRVTLASDRVPQPVIRRPPCQMKDRRRTLLVPEVGIGRPFTFNRTPAALPSTRSRLVFAYNFTDLPAGRIWNRTTRPSVRACTQQGAVVSSLASTPRVREDAGGRLV